MPYCDIRSTSRRKGLGSKVTWGVVAEPLYNIAYLSKRLRRQGQTEGALTNTKVLLVST